MRPGVSVLVPGANACVFPFVGQWKKMLGMYVHVNSPLTAVAHKMSKDETEMGGR
jgi:hypothetical protein